MAIGLYNRRFVPRRQRARVALAALNGGGTPEEIQAKIIAIKEVITSGVESAAYGDKKTEFRSLTELREILAGLEEALEDALGLGGKVRQIRVLTQSDKGL